MKTALQFTKEIFKAENLHHLQEILNNGGKFAMWDCVPVFDLDVPAWDGVRFNFSSRSNCAYSGYEGKFRFAIVSWDAENFLVADCCDVDRDLFIVSRSEFWRKNGSDL